METLKRGRPLGSTNSNKICHIKKVKEDKLILRNEAKLSKMLSKKWINESIGKGG